MNKLLIWILICGVGADASAAVTVESCNFDDVYQQDSFACDVIFANDAAKSAKITDIRSASTSDVLSQTSFSLEPHETKHVDVRLNLLGNYGEASHFFSYKIDGMQSETGFAISGFVSSILDQFKPTIDLGTINIESIGDASGKIRLSSRESKDLRILRVVQCPDYLSCAMEGATLSVTAKAATNWGIHRGPVILELNSSRQRMVRVDTALDVHGQVVADSNPYAMGLIRTNGKNEITIRVTDRTHEKLHLGQPTLTKLSGKATVDDCVPNRADCRLIKFKFDDKQPTGSVAGTIDIPALNYAQSLKVVLWGLLLKPDAEVIDMDKAMMENKNGATTTGTTDLHSLLQQATSPNAEPQIPDGSGPLLRWQVANEAVLHGYVVYRSDEKAGDYQRVNEQLIPAKGHDGGSSYAFRDNSASAGKSYWYYVGLIYRDGHKQELTDPQQVVAK